MRAARSPDPGKKWNLHIGYMIGDDEIENGNQDIWHIKQLPKDKDTGSLQGLLDQLNGSGTLEEFENSEKFKDLPLPSLRSI